MKHPTAELRTARAFIRACRRPPERPDAGELLDAITREIQALPIHLRAAAQDRLRYHLSECLIDLTER